VNARTKTILISAITVLVLRRVLHRLEYFGAQRTNTVPVVQLSRQQLSKDAYDEGTRSLASGDTTSPSRRSTRR